MQKPVTAIVVGAGRRGNLYAAFAKMHPEKLKIIGVADPNEIRRERFAEKYEIAPEMQFYDADALAEKPRLADAIINGTMDQDHVKTAIPLLKRGYDMLLEKPFAVEEGEMRALAACAKENGNKVMICHVLRYAPFYNSIKRELAGGVIGDIMNIQLSEHVSYHHLSASFVRGPWRNAKKTGASMLLAKCCHDIDMMMWLMGADKPVSVASFGGKFQFRPENAPKEAGTVCMKDCPLVDTCVYSAKRLSLDHPNRWVRTWDGLEHLETITQEDRIAYLKGDTPYGRCIYKCDNDIVDHQSVMVQFASGATGTHNLVGSSSQAMRKLHIIGTKGEIYGNFENSKYTISLIDPSPDAHAGECRRTEVDLNITGDMSGAYGGHGGGDMRLVDDFVSYVSGREASIACTSIFDSVAGHLCVYLADRSMAQGGAPQKVVL